MKDNMSIEVSMPPLIYNRHDGKRFAVSGQHWIEIDESTTLETIDKYMVYKSRVKTNNSNADQTWIVEGSKGNKYTVTLSDNQWSCTCVGFNYRRKCKHVQLKKDNIYNVGANGN